MMFVFFYASRTGEGYNGLDQHCGLHQYGILGFRRALELIEMP